MRLLTDDVWRRAGMSVLWGEAELAQVAPPSQVLSVRKFFRLAESLPDDLPSGDGNAVVVAGLDDVLVSLSERDAATWLREDLGQQLSNFESRYEGQAAVIFWLPEGRPRIRPDAASDQYELLLEPTGKRAISLGRDLWPGHDGGIRRIIASSEREPDPSGPAWKGLWIRRIHS